MSRDTSDYIRFTMRTSHAYQSDVGQYYTWMIAGWCIRRGSFHNMHMYNYHNEFCKFTQILAVTR